MTEQLIPDKIVAKRWLCSIHGVECSLGYPCYACVDELANPEKISSEEVPTNQAIRVANSKPRIRI